jgi:hypothetical protein
MSVASVPAAAASERRFGRSAEQQYYSQSKHGHTRDCFHRFHGHQLRS